MSSTRSRTTRSRTTGSALLPKGATKTVYTKQPKNPNGAINAKSPLDSFLLLPPSGQYVDKSIQSMPPETQLTGAISQQDLVILEGNQAIAFLLEPITRLDIPGNTTETNSHFFLVVAPTTIFQKFEINNEGNTEQLKKLDRVFNCGYRQGTSYAKKIKYLLQQNLDIYKENFLPGDTDDVKGRKKILFELKRYIVNLLETNPRAVSFVFFNGQLPTPELNLSSIPFENFGNLETPKQFEDFLNSHFESLKKNPRARSFSASASAYAGEPQVSTAELAAYAAAYGPRGGKSKKKSIKKKKNKQRKSKKSKKSKKSRRSKIKVKARTHRRH